MSNAMAVLLQTLGARLGIVTGRDLAQACRETYPRPVNLALWFLCEIAIVACDLAEVLGAAIALNLLFPYSVAGRRNDYLVRYPAGALAAALRHPLSRSLHSGADRDHCGLFHGRDFHGETERAGILGGLVPRIDSRSLYTAIAMLGATVMPHNLYLHSALVQTRRIGRSVAEKRTACQWNLVDCVVALNGAMFVNAAILILAAAVFFRAHSDVTEIQQAYLLLAPLMGTVVAAKLFGIALLARGNLPR